ncbi:hypothetical protein L1887_23758 [Cichorium endivia]|nr:hypothetical protein L1887_23758 [Cichorium endivia]
MITIGTAGPPSSIFVTLSTGSILHKARFFSEVEYFEKLPKQNLSIGNTNEYQLDLPFNTKMFAHKQFTIKMGKEGVDTFSELKIIFHAVLGKPENEVWILKKIIGLINIDTYVYFEDTLKNYITRSS